MGPKKANKFFVTVDIPAGLCYNWVNHNYPEANMELGEKLRQARLAAGLSQRQLCGDVITRNMLSQIEHGTARPSMATLQYLAERLGKSVSFFLEDSVSPNQALMTHARRAYAEGKFEEVRAILEGFTQPDDFFDREYRYLYALTTFQAARKAMDKGKILYARALLTDLQSLTQSLPELERQRVVLLGQVCETGLPELCRCLPDLDEELFLRARAAMEAGQFPRGMDLLRAMERRDTPRWQLLMGRLSLASCNYGEAAGHLKQAEQEYPRETAPLLEHCYRELGDYKQAYLYACKQR